MKLYELYGYSGGMKSAWGKQYLPPHAVEILQKWYAKHVDWAYPHREEKEALAREAGITVDQVKNWFINTRRRRKQEMKKRFVKRLNRESGIYINFQEKNRVYLPSEFAKPGPNAVGNCAEKYLKIDTDNSANSDNNKSESANKSPCSPISALTKLANSPPVVEQTPPPTNKKDSPIFTPYPRQNQKAPMPKRYIEAIPLYDYTPTTSNLRVPASQPTEVPYFQSGGQMSTTSNLRVPASQPTEVPYFTSGGQMAQQCQIPHCTSAPQHQKMQLLPSFGNSFPNMTDRNPRPMMPQAPPVCTCFRSPRFRPPCPPDCKTLRVAPPHVSQLHTTVSQMSVTSSFGQVSSTPTSIDIRQLMNETTPPQNSMLKTLSEESPTVSRPSQTNEDLAGEFFPVDSQTENAIPVARKQPLNYKLARYTTRITRSSELSAKCLRLMAYNMKGRNYTPPNGAPMKQNINEDQVIRSLSFSSVTTHEATTLKGNTKYISKTPQRVTVKDLIDNGYTRVFRPINAAPTCCKSRGCAYPAICPPGQTYKRCEDQACMSRGQGDLIRSPDMVPVSFVNSTPKMRLPNIEMFIKGLPPTPELASIAQLKGILGMNNPEPPPRQEMTRKLLATHHNREVEAANSLLDLSMSVVTHSRSKY